METSAKKRRPMEESEVLVDETAECETPIALQLPEILKKILTNLQTPALLQCSLVCKAWNYESRCLLRDSRTLVAVIKSADPCMKLLEFETLLSSMTLVPYSGLRICVNEGSKNIYCLRALDLDQVYPSVLKLNLKYLRIDWREGNWEHDEEKDCAAILLLRKVFRLGLHLEQVDLRLPDWVDLFSTEVTDVLELPHLRVLKLLEDPGEFLADAIFRLVRAAPQLEQLYMRVEHHEWDELPDDKLKCITDLEFAPQNESHLDFLEQVALAGAKLQKLYVFVNPEQFFNSDRIWRVLRLVLECCCKDSLSYFYLDVVAALKLTNLRVSLDKLEKIEIGRLNRSNNTDLQLASLLGNLDLGAVFPALKNLKLHLHMSPYSEGEVEWFLMAQRLAQQEHFSRNYEGRLTLTLFPCIDQTNLHRIASTFPNIRSLTVSVSTREPIHPQWTLLWELWPGLPRLEVELGRINKGDHDGCLTSVLNFDAEFCGISPEEAADLQEKDEEFLHKVHIVPTRPAITGLRELETFSLRINVPVPENLSAGDPSSLLLLSKVTGCIAFRRMTFVDIRVEVFHDDFTEFQHLEPYATLVSRDSRRED